VPFGMSSSIDSGYLGLYLNEQPICLLVGGLLATL
jgi:hypothetical protein